MHVNFFICFISILFFSFSHFSTFAQGFGRNKVLYEKFDFKIQRTAHFSIHHYLDSISAKNISYLSERWYNRYENLFHDTFHAPLPIIIYADHADFQQTEIISGLIDVGTGGVTEGLKNRLVMPLDGSYRSFDHVLGHEMTHMFQYHLLRTSDTLRVESIFYVPLWLVEGMAEYLSMGNENTLTSMWLRNAVLHNDVPSIKKINYDYRYNPYRYGHALCSFIAGFWGDTIIPKLFLNTARFGFEPAVKMTLEISEDSLSKLWVKTIKETYEPQIVELTKSYAIGKNILSANKQGGRIYLEPSISPDGKKVVFYSETTLFSIEIFLADMRDGKIIRKLGKRDANRHYDELNFISSSGAWSPDSKKFAYPAFSKGNQKIIIADVNTGKILEAIGFSGIRSILNIDWSPDGKKMVFSASGTNSRMTDLYLYDFLEKNLVQLTHDAYGDLHPAFSPDGKIIAFATDRGKDTDTAKYIFGKMKICFYDLSSGKINILNLSENAMHINPQFSPDGNSVFFISDPDGINNIYRYDLNTKQIYKITNLATGVSGLTDLSPAITIAKQSGEILFTVYDDNQFKGYSITKEQMLAQKINNTTTLHKLNILPPQIKESNIVQNYIDSPAGTKISQNIIKTNYHYKPRISLDYIGGLYAGAGFSQYYGTALQGGVFFRFSDVMNYHVLHTVIQVNGKITDVAAMGIYINQKNRMHWGGYVSHIPYLSSSIGFHTDTLNSNGSSIVVPVVDQIITRSFEERIAILGSYPLSKINRLEFYAGETFTNYSRERTTYYPSDAPVKNFVSTEKLSAPDAIRYTGISTTFVSDNSFFGITDPLKGYRCRFQAEQIINSYKFVNFLADYRKYFFVKPFSFAFRALHYGRYFKDAENGNLFPLYLGDEFLIKGYSIFSFNPNECNNIGELQTCPVFDRLLGSKIAIINTELRLPFTGYERLAVIKSRGFFSSLNIFADGGVAWKKNDEPFLIIATSSAKKIPVFSSGISYRINLYGVAILDFYYAYPFQRPQRGWHFGFIITQGW